MNRKKKKKNSNVTSQKDAIMCVGSSWLMYWERRMVIAQKIRHFKLLKLKGKEKKKGMGTIGSGRV